jgi:uncharacterized protein
MSNQRSRNQRFISPIVLLALARPRARRDALALEQNKPCDPDLNGAHYPLLPVTNVGCHGTLLHNHDQYQVIFNVPFAALFFLPTHAPAVAASFACAKAERRRERQICNDQALSGLDLQLGRLYQERRALLSPHGAPVLKNSEQSWIRFVTTVCPIDIGKGAPEMYAARNSLQQRFQNRLKQIAMVGQKQGPFLFNRIDIVAAQPAADQTGSTLGFLTQHVAYPQIDNIDAPATSAWNKNATRVLPIHSDCEDDDDDDYVIGFANDRMIGTRWSSYT